MRRSWNSEKDISVRFTPRGFRTRPLNYERGRSGKQSATKYPENPSKPVVLLVMDSNGRNIVNPQRVYPSLNTSFDLAAISIPGGNTIHACTELLHLNQCDHTVSHVVLAIGTNDMSEGEQVLSRFPSRVQNLIRVAQDVYPSADISYVSVLPRHDEFSGIISEANKQIRQIMKNFRLPFLSVSIPKESFLWSDCIHLSDEGLRLFMKNFETEVETKLFGNTDFKSACQGKPQDEPTISLTTPVPSVTMDTRKLHQRSSLWSANNFGSIGVNDISPTDDYRRQISKTISRRKFFPSAYTDSASSTCSNLEKDRKNESSSYKSRSFHRRSSWAPSIGHNFDSPEFKFRSKRRQSQDAKDQISKFVCHSKPSSPTDVHDLHHLSEVNLESSRSKNDRYASTLEVKSRRSNIKKSKLMSAVPSRKTENNLPPRFQNKSQLVPYNATSDSDTTQLVPYSATSDSDTTQLVPYSATSDSDTTQLVPYSATSDSDTTQLVPYSATSDSDTSEPQFENEVETRPIPVISPATHRRNRQMAFRKISSKIRNRTHSVQRASAENLTKQKPTEIDPQEEHNDSPVTVASIKRRHGTRWITDNHYEPILSQTESSGCRDENGVNMRETPRQPMRYFDQDGAQRSKIGVDPVSPIPHHHVAPECKALHDGVISPITLPSKRGQRSNFMNHSGDISDFKPVVSGSSYSGARDTIEVENSLGQRSNFMHDITSSSNVSHEYCRTRTASSGIAINPKTVVGPKSCSQRSRYTAVQLDTNNPRQNRTQHLGGFPFAVGPCDSIEVVDQHSAQDATRLVRYQSSWGQGSDFTTSNSDQRKPHCDSSAILGRRSRVDESPDNADKSFDQNVRGQIPGVISPISPNPLGILGQSSTLQLNDTITDEDMNLFMGTNINSDKCFEQETDSSNPAHVKKKRQTLELYQPPKARVQISLD